MELNSTRSAMGTSSFSSEEIASDFVKNKNAPFPPSRADLLAILNPSPQQKHLSDVTGSDSFPARKLPNCRVGLAVHTAASLPRPSRFSLFAHDSRFTMTIASSGSFYLRETGDIRTVYEVFLLCECPVHVVNILMLLAAPRLIFSSKMLANINLKIIIVSYFLAGLLMSISRLSWLVCEMFRVPIDTMEVFMYSRFVFQTSISAHLFVFSAERAIATCRSKRYEQNSFAPLIIICCFLTYPYSLCQLYSKYNFEKGREINVITIVSLSLLSLLVTTVVLAANKKKVKHRRFKAPISEAYQMRENIRTSRLLLQMFSLAAFFLATSCYFLLQFSASLTDPTRNWSTITNGFLYDMLVSVGTTSTTLVFLQFLIPDEVQRKWLLILRFPCRREVVHPATKHTSFRSIHGVEVAIGSGTAEEEARVYFSQLSIAWKL